MFNVCRQEKYLRYKRLKKQIKAARTSREQYLEAFAQVKGTRVHTGGSRASGHRATLTLLLPQLWQTSPGARPMCC
jgi:hypothetical protein